MKALLKQRITTNDSTTLVTFRQRLNIYMSVLQQFTNTDIFLYSIDWEIIKSQKKLAFMKLYNIETAVKMSLFSNHSLLFCFHIQFLRNILAIFIRMFISNIRLYFTITITKYLQSG